MPLRKNSVAIIKVKFILIALLLPNLSFSQSKTSMSASDIYDHSKMSVVVINTADNHDKPIGQGLGFIVSKDHIVTNHHVMAGVAEAVVSYADGISVIVDGIAADSASRDLTIISAKTGERPPLHLGNEFSIHEGDFVYAIGAPQGLQLSIINGIVSGFRQMDEQFLIQSTTPIAPGSSGGPLFDKEGHVVGVTTSLLANTPGVYFSIGSGDVSRLLRTPNPVILSLSSWAETSSGATTANDSENETAPRHSQDGQEGTPSLQDTLSGIETFTNAYSSRQVVTTNGARYTWRSVLHRPPVTEVDAKAQVSSACVVVIDSTFPHAGGVGIASERRWVPLGEIAINNIAVKAYPKDQGAPPFYEVTLETSNSSFIWKLETKYDGPEGFSPCCVKAAGLFFMSEEKAMRFATAIKHAATLCGAKASLF